MPLQDQKELQVTLNAPTLQEKLQITPHASKRWKELQVASHTLTFERSYDLSSHTSKPQNSHVKSPRRAKFRRDCRLPHIPLLQSEAASCLTCLETIDFSCEFESSAKIETRKKLQVAPQTSRPQRERSYECENPKGKNTKEATSCLTCFEATEIIHVNETQSTARGSQFPCSKCPKAPEPQAKPTVFSDKVTIGRFIRPNRTRILLRPCKAGGQTRVKRRTNGS